MATTAIVARRIGENKPKKAALAGMQAILLAFIINSILSIIGWIYAKDILIFMSNSEETANYGLTFFRIMIGSSIFIILLFLINGIFRGVGNAAIAMRSLWIANILNIIFNPLLIRGWGIIPAFGLDGSAIATTIGRASGVIYLLYNLFDSKKVFHSKLIYFNPDWKIIKSLGKIATPAILQFVIASCSWIFLAQLVAVTGGDHGSAGYQTALRIMTFFILPAWGLSNSATTLVGQNLGANNPLRAEQAVKIAAKYNAFFMGTIMILTLIGGQYVIGFFTNDPEVKTIAIKALNIMSYGYIIYGLGMVFISSFNGAGDTKTPTIINFICFWLFQIPFAHFLAKYYNLGPTGVFISIPVTETIITIIAIILFRRGFWKKIKI